MLRDSLTLPAVEAGQPTGVLPRQTAGADLLVGAPHWRCFALGFAGSFLEARDTLTPPDEIVWQPRGCSILYCAGREDRVIWTPQPGDASVANRDLSLMRAVAAAGRGTMPFFDFSHQGHLGGVAGHPVSFFWDPPRGICCQVSWSAAGEAAILSGSHSGFSPEWVRRNDEFTGLRPNCGALLGPGEESAFAKMPLIKPISALQRAELRRERFLRLVDKRMRSSNPSISLVAAFEIVQAEAPELFAAYQLVEALAIERRQRVH